MSERPSASASSGPPTSDATRSEPSYAPTSLPPSTFAASVAASVSPQLARHAQPSGRVLELPPLPRAQPPTGGTPLPSARSASFSSILNPTQPDEASQPRRRKASQLESSPPSVPSLPPLITGPTSAARHGATRVGFPSSPAHSAAPTELQGRRILTPRSPSLHRAASLGQLNSQAGFVGAQQSPFPTSPRTRTYTAEPGVAGVPPLPNPAAGARPSYAFPAPPTPSAAGGRTSAGAAPEFTRPPSSSASPSTSYSSYGPGGQTSPSGQYVTASMPGLSEAYAAGSEGIKRGSASTSMPSASTPHERQRPFGIPISSAAGQTVYQMMTLETTSGTVQLPVDVQAASRVADEKRRRNAGASARFRARRKEKEKEASGTIAKLELQLKHLSEDVDFYRRERGYLAGIVLQVPGGERHFPRPQSPRHRRSSSILEGGSAGYMSDPDVPPSPDEGRNVRRRTSTISLAPPGPNPAHVAVGQPMLPSYVPAQLGAPPMPHARAFQSAPQPPLLLNMQSLPGPASLPPPIRSQHASPAGPPPQLGPWNPYAQDGRVPPPPPDRPRDSR